MRTSSGLKTTILDALKGTTGTYGIVVKNLKTEESFSINDHKVFESGSLYKVWIMATVFDQIQSGILKKSDELSQDVAILNDKFQIATESAEMKEGKITMSVGVALEQMITISHNYAAFLLSEKVRLSNVLKFLKKHGFNESTVGGRDETPKTTPYDMALFFEKLYKGELGDKNSTEEMIELLKKQRLTSKLPKYLPNGAVIAHKTGEIGSFSHDAGIVFHAKGDYIISAFSESDFPEGAEDRIAQVSQNVYHYFAK